MPSCCYADEYGAYFTPGEAARRARRYLRKGLRGTAHDLADAVAALGITDATLLEIGGGVGELQADLLRRGAARSVNVELSPSWEDAAGAMLAELGLADRVERRVGDVVDLADELPDVDVVLLHRTVCCYPDWPAMLDVAVARARRAVGLTLPVERRATRAAIGLGNAWLRLRGRSFRAFVHPVDRIVTAAERAGFATVDDRSGPVWRTIVAARPAT